MVIPARLHCAWPNYHKAGMGSCHAWEFGVFFLFLTLQDFLGNVSESVVP